MNHSTPREPDLTTNQLDYLRGILEAHQVPDPLRRIFARARLTETGQMIGATKYQRGLRDALVALHGVIRDVEVRKSLRAELGLLAVNEAAREGR